MAGLTSGGSLRGKGHPHLDRALAVESGREGTDSGRPLGQLLAAPPPARAESNSYKRRDRLRLGESQGLSLNSRRPHSHESRCRLRSSAESTRRRTSVGRREHTHPESPAVGEGRAEPGPGSWRGANWESGVVCWLRPLPAGGGERYISAVVALDVLFRNGFAVRTQVSGGCVFRGPGRPALSGPGRCAGVVRWAFLRAFPPRVAGCAGGRVRGLAAPRKPCLVLGLRPSVVSAPPRASPAAQWLLPSAVPIGRGQQREAVPRHGVILTADNEMRVLGRARPAPSTCPTPLGWGDASHLPRRPGVGFNV